MISATMPTTPSSSRKRRRTDPRCSAICRSGGFGQFYTMASGGLGYGLPAAVGVALAKPDRRVIAIIGDGSLMYSIQALWTAAQHRLPLSVVVINNGGYGAMRSFSQTLKVKAPPGIDLPGIDSVQIAKGFGCAALCGSTWHRWSGAARCVAHGRAGADRRAGRSSGDKLY